MKEIVIAQPLGIGIKKFVNLTEKKFNIIKGRCFGTVQFFDRNIEKMMKSFCKQLDD